MHLHGVLVGADLTRCRRELSQQRQLAKCSVEGLATQHQAGTDSLTHWGFEEGSGRPKHTELFKTLSEHGGHT